MNTDSEADDPQAAAIELLKALAPQGHAISFLAGALKRACISTPSGKGTTWHVEQVRRLASKAGIQVGYRRVG